MGLIRPSTTADSSPRKLPKEQAITQKLAYEWKNIYRFLNSNESMPRGQGLVSHLVFEQALQACNVKLTRQETQYLKQRYQVED